MVNQNEKHSEFLERLDDAQEMDRDNRQHVREADHFANKRDGQWQPEVIMKMDKRPRYTFDKVNPIIDQIMFPVTQSDFYMDVRMAGGDATQEVANLYGGMIRNSENLSGARHIYDLATREMVTTGMAGWQIVHDYVDADAFSQDLLIKPLSDFVNRVWFDPQAVLQTMTDANWCTVLTTMLKENYDKKYPKCSGLSVGDGRSSSVYETMGDTVVVGRLMYKKKESRELVLMSNNAIYAVDEEYEKVKDELTAAGITEIDRRKRDAIRIYSRKYDGGDWLEDAKKTNFTLLPVIPAYANFRISEGKVIYWGVVEKLMDPQRVLNYAESRDIEEGALAPRGKYWMTRDQAKLDLDKLYTMNVNADPVQTYDHVEGQPPPFWQDGARTNQGLQVTAAKASEHINMAAGLYGANLADNPGLQSGVAIERQQNKGDQGSHKYLESRSVAQEHTCRVMIKAMPLVYDRKQQTRTVQQDGTTEMVTLHDEVFDQQTRTFVKINDLSTGVYDVTCTIGPAYNNRQEETVDKMVATSAIDPSLIEIGADVLYNNMQTPGFDQIADRKRALMVKAGVIPEDQMTEEEKATVQAAAQQGQQPSAMDQALLIQAQTEQQKTMATIADIQSKMQEREAKAQERQLKLEMDMAKQTDTIALADKKLQLEIQKQVADGQQALYEMIKTQADTLKAIKEAMGADTIVGPGNTKAYEQQAEILKETQLST